VTQTAEKWCFLSGRIAAMEARLIRDEAMQRMVRLDKLDDVFLSVSDTRYKEYFPIIETLYEADGIVSSAYMDHVQEVARYSPAPDVADMFVVQFDFRGFKAYLKNTLAGLDVQFGNRSSVSVGTWERVYNDLKTPLPGFWYRAAGLIRAEHDESHPEQTAQVIDLVLDAEYLIQQEAAAQALGYPLIVRWAEMLKLVSAIEILWRAKGAAYDPEQVKRLFLRDSLNASLLKELHALPLADWPDRLRFSPVGRIVDDVFSQQEGDRLTEFVRLGENLLLDIVRPARNVAFGPDRVFGYLCALRTEAYNLRLVLSGKVNKISEELLAARVRTQYV